MDQGIPAQGIGVGGGGQLLQVHVTHEELERGCAISEFKRRARAGGDIRVPCAVHHAPGQYCLPPGLGFGDHPAHFPVREIGDCSQAVVDGRDAAVGHIVVSHLLEDLRIIRVSCGGPKEGRGYGAARDHPRLDLACHAARHGSMLLTVPAGRFHGTDRDIAPQAAKALRDDRLGSGPRRADRGGDARGPSSHDQYFAFQKDGSLSALLNDFHSITSGVL